MKIRGNLSAQGLVRNLVADMPAGLQFTQLQNTRIAHKAQYPRLKRPVDTLPERIECLWEHPEKPLLHWPDGTVRLGHDPRWCALVQVYLCRLLRHLRNKLDGRGTGPDHRHPLAAQIVVVIPVLGVETLAREGFDPLDLRIRRRAQSPHSGNEDIGPQGSEFRQPLIGSIQPVSRLHASFLHVRPKRRTITGFNNPPLVGLIKSRSRHVGVQPDVLHQPVFLGAMFQIRLDLVLLGIHPAPVRVLLEGEGVECRLHVTGTPRVVVLVPGATDVVTLLQDHEVVVAGFLEFDGHAQAGESGADDGDLCVLCHCCTPALAPVPQLNGTLDLVCCYPAGHHGR